MAGQDYYVDATVEAGKQAEACYSNGSAPVYMIKAFELPVSDGSGTVDVYRVFKGLNPNLIPVDIKIYSDDAIVGATDLDVGLYEQSGDRGDGVEIDDDVFADGIDITAGNGFQRGAGTAGMDEYLDGLVTVDIADMYKKLYEHAGHDVTDYTQGYDLCITNNVNVTTGGTVTVIAQFIKG